MKRLPRSLSDLDGLRAALWVRESTAGQFDAFGPDAQRKQYATALTRWGLVDTGVAWSVAHSGWKIALGIADGMPSTLTLRGGYGRGERSSASRNHLSRAFHVNLRGRRTLRGARTA